MGWFKLKPCLRSLASSVSPHHASYTGFDQLVGHATGRVRRYATWTASKVVGVEGGISIIKRDPEDHPFRNISFIQALSNRQFDLFSLYPSLFALSKIHRIPKKYGSTRLG